MKENGIDELRTLLNILNNSRDSALEHFTAEQLINIARACRASEWDITLEYLMFNERKYAAEHGTLSKECVARLDKELS